MRRSPLITVFIMFFAVSAHGQNFSPLTLQRVVSLYIERNLELQAEWYRLERTKADAIAARLRPNPGVSVMAENLRVSGPVAASRLYELGATYSETIELGGKRKLREQVAAVTISAGEARFANAMRKGIAEVRRPRSARHRSRHRKPPDVSTIGSIQSGAIPGRRHS